LLTDICSSSLWHKLMHIMAIVCDPPWNLQVTRIIPSTTNSHNFQCKTKMSSNFNDTSLILLQFHLQTVHRLVSTICIAVPIPIKEMECTMHPPTLVRTSFY
jgi:hypothetical protein